MQEINDVLTKIRTLAQRRDLRLIPNLLICNPANSEVIAKEYHRILQESRLFESLCSRESFLEINYTVSTYQVTESNPAFDMIRNAAPTTNSFMGVIQFNLCFDIGDIESSEAHQLYDYVRFHDRTRFVFNCCMSKPLSEKVLRHLEKSFNTVFIDMSEATEQPEDLIIKRIETVWPAFDLDDEILREVIRKIPSQDLCGTDAIERYVYEIVAKRVLYEGNNDQLINSISKHSTTEMGFKP